MSSPVVASTPRTRVRRSLAGPIVLITMGVIFLLGNMHLISWRSLGVLFAHYWPVLIILWGVIKLVEYYQAKSEGVPASGIGVGGGLLIFFIIMFGMAASSAERVNWGALRNEMDIQDDSGFFNVFGQAFTYEDQLEQDFPASGASVKIVSDRGGVSVHVWDQNRIKVLGHKKVYASNQTEADKRAEGAKPQLTNTGSSYVLNANVNNAGNGGVATDLEVFLPRAAAVDVVTRRGDVSVLGREGAVKVSDHRGDISLENINGLITVTMERGDARINKVTGDVSVEGRADDIEVAEITGQLKLTGDFFGTVRVSKIAKGVSFHSSRTDLEMGKVDGELTFDSGDLRANQVAGPVRLQTRSKDIHLEDVSGDVRIEDNNGSVEVHPADKSLGNIDISTNSDVRLMLPSKAAFNLTARTNRGEIQSDFESLQVSKTGSQSSASGSVGSGGPRVQVTSQHGDIEIRKTT